MENLVGRKVYNKRNGTHGTIVAQDSLTFVIDYSGIQQTVSLSTFKRWNEVMDEEKKETEPKQEEAPVTPPPVESKKTEKEGTGKKVDVGAELRDRFISIVKDIVEDGPADYKMNPDRRYDVVKYGGKNVFEIYYQRKKLVVMCHPDSLTPDNTKRAAKIYPKDWGWTLRARFEFNEISQTPLMKSIITDGLFYRGKL